MQLPKENELAGSALSLSALKSRIFGSGIYIKVKIKSRIQNFQSKSLKSTVKI